MGAPSAPAAVVPAQSQTVPYKPLTKEVLAHDSNGDVLAAAGGKLKLTPAQNGGEAEWIHPGGRAELTWLPVVENRLLIYGAQGPYAGLELGTPCDGHF